MLCIWLCEFYIIKKIIVKSASCCSSATAHVKKDEVVLVHAGASGIGTAAVQLVRLLGAVPIVTAGSAEKLKLAQSLGAAAGFNYREGSFTQGVHDFTGGEFTVYSAGGRADLFASVTNEVSN